METLGPLDWTICIGYLAVVLALGFWFAREQHNNEDYFVGGRKMHWLPIGLSIFAGTFSSLSFVGLPQDAAYYDYHLLLGILFIPFVVMPLVGWLFIPLYFRLGLTSAYEYLERRFDRRVRLLAAALFMAYTIGWMGNLLVAVGRILQAVLDLSSDVQVIGILVAVGLFATLYTTLGGVKAVVWTDCLQALALGGGMLAVLLLAVGKVDGGWSTVWDVGMKYDKFAMFRMEFDFSSWNFFGACAFGFFVYLAGHAVHFTAVQRYVSMPTVRAARWSLAVNGIMVSVTCLVFFLVGTTLFVFYHPPADASAAQVAASQRLAHSNLWQELKHTEEKQKAELPNEQDQLLPRFIMAELPVSGLMGLLLAGLFAAAMSSIDSGINSLTAVVVCDWLSGRERGLWFSRVLTIIFGLAAVSVAVLIHVYLSEKPVFHILMSIAGSFLGLLLGIFLLGMLSPRTNSNGTLLGALGGTIIWIVANRSGLSFWWDGACMTVSTLFVGLFASLLFPPPDEKSLKGLEVGRQREETHKPEKSR